MDKTTTKKTIKQYLREVKKHLTDSPLEKMAMLADLKEHLFDSYGDESELTLETLYENVGTPEETAKSFFDTRDLSKFRKRAKRNAIIALAVCVAAIALCTASVFTTIYVMKEADDNHSTITNYQTET